VHTAVYARDDLRPGARIEGPAIIEQLDSTVVIPPEDKADVDGWSNIIIRVGGEEK
jgi:N-methylhydantoinase A